MKKSIKSIISEEIKKTLKESVDILIKDLPQDDKLYTLGDISHQMNYEIGYNFAVKYDEEIKKKIIDAIRGYSYITPDGDEYFNETGTINFYSHKFPEDLKAVVLSFLRYALMDRGIKMGKVRIERKGQKSEVIRIPIVSNSNKDTNDAPQLNLSNENAVFIFKEILGYEYKNDFEEYNEVEIYVDELLNKINMAKSMLDYQGHPEKSTRDMSTPKNIYANINGKDYIREKLDQLENIAKYAKEHGYDELYLG